MEKLTRPPRNRASLLVLDNAVDHDLYRPVEHWARAAGFTPHSVYVPGGEPLPDPDRHSHVIISGSEASILEPQPWADLELRWIALAAASGAAVLGSCWGHQLLALAFAGPGAVRRSKTPELGWKEVQVSDDAGLLPPGRFATFVSHFDEVVPGSHEDMRVLARTPTCAVQAMQWGAGPVYGVQAHPEIDQTAGFELLRRGLDRWPDHAELYRRGLDGPARDSGSARGLVRRFLSITPPLTSVRDLPT